MGKALSGELSCPCDRSCFPCGLTLLFQNLNMYADLNGKTLAVTRTDRGSGMQYQVKSEF